MATSRPKKRVLFVCRKNQVRSLTAEQVYRDRADLEVRSAGIAEYASVPLTQELFEWADQVFVFTKRQLKVIENRFGNSSRGKKLVCLNLPDRFEYKSPKLIIKLTGKLGPYLGAPASEGSAVTVQSSVASPSSAVVLENESISTKTATTPPRQAMFNIFSNLFFGVMALPFVTGFVLLSPVMLP